MRDIIAMIPARAGSKRLPGKNTKLLNGKPLIQYTIDAACQSRSISYAEVTTDCKECERLALHSGIGWSLRPKELATASASMRSVLQYFVAGLTEFFKDTEFMYGEKRFCPGNTAIMVLYPTYPLRDSEEIDRIINFYRHHEDYAVIGIKEPATHPAMCYRYVPDESGKMRMNNVMAIDRNQYFRCQDYPQVRELTHYACVIPCECVPEVDSQLIHPARQLYFEVDKRKAIDIDTQEDFDFAEYLLTRKSVASIAD